MKVRTVTQGRMKPRYNPVPTAAEARHREEVRKHGCAKGCGGPVEVHHLKQMCAGKRWSARDHRFQVPLCFECHRGDSGVHALEERKWCERNDCDLPALAVRLEAESVAMGILSDG